MENFLPAVLDRVPTKTEMKSLVQDLKKNENLSIVQKYIIGKGMETLAKEVIAEFKTDAIDDFLQINGGSMKAEMFGVDIQITNERKDVTMKKYKFSEKVDEIELEISQMENELKLKRQELKLQQTLEVNRNIAKEIETEELFSEPEYGIKITLKK